MQSDCHNRATNIRGTDFRCGKGKDRGPTKTVTDSKKVNSNDGNDGRCRGATREDLIKSARLLLFRRHIQF